MTNYYELHQACFTIAWHTYPNCCSHVLRCSVVFISTHAWAQCPLLSRALSSSESARSQVPLVVLRVTSGLGNACSRSLNPRHRFQTDVPSERSQAEAPEQETPSGRFQAKDTKRKLPSRSSQPQVLKRNIRSGRS